MQSRRVALISGGMRITYETLRHEGRGAAALPEEGEVIAVLLPRDRRLFAAMVGIMQANCAWLLLPLDLPPAHPEHPSTERCGTATFHPGSHSAAG